MLLNTVENLVARSIRLTGINRSGRAAWVKDYGHISGIVTTENPEEAHVFHDEERAFAVYSGLRKGLALRNVAIQFINRY